MRGAPALNEVGRLVPGSLDGTLGEKRPFRGSAVFIRIFKRERELELVALERRLGELGDAVDGEELLPQAHARNATGTRARATRRALGPGFVPLATSPRLRLPIRYVPDS